MTSMTMIFLFVVAVACVSAQIPQHPEIKDRYPNNRYKYLLFKRADVAGRSRRQVRLETPVGGGTAFGALGSGSSGPYGKLGYERNIFANNRGKLDGQLYGQRTLTPMGGVNSMGGRLDYSHPNGGASVDVNRYNHFGTVVSGAGQANFPINKNWNGFAQGSVSKNVDHHGRPDIGAMVGIQGRF